MMGSLQPRSLGDRDVMISSVKEPQIMIPLLLESDLSLCSNVRHVLDAQNESPAF